MEMCMASRLNHVSGAKASGHRLLSLGIGSVTYMVIKIIAALVVYLLTWNNA